MWLGAAGLLAVALLWLAWSLGGALLEPGTDPLDARVAEWARSNGLGFVVGGLEQIQYQVDPPKVGGTVAGGIPSVAPLLSDTGSAGGSTSPTASGGAPDPASPAATGAGPTPSPTPVVVASPAPITPIVSPPLPREGTWQTLDRLNGQPVLRAAFLRPDAQHTSYLAGVVWIDQSQVKLVLHPGYQLPGGSGWSQATQVLTAQRSSLLATFNSGFRLDDANGGWWADGQAAVPLKPGAASLVFYKDGHVDIVQWGSAAPGPDVAAVRQNLVLLVDNGVVSPLVNSTTTTTWGKTLTGAFFVWRTAIGIRADGSLVFVIGPALSAGSLARIAQAAGAVRAMELDINPAWTNFITYTHPSKGVAVPHMLTPDEQPNPYRYLQPSSRDFIAVMTR